MAANVWVVTLNISEQRKYGKWYLRENRCLFSSAPVRMILRARMRNLTSLCANTYTGILIIFKSDVSHGAQHKVTKCSSDWITPGEFVIHPIRNGKGAVILKIPSILNQAVYITPFTIFRSSMLPAGSSVYSVRRRGSRIRKLLVRKHLLEGMPWHSASCNKFSVYKFSWILNLTRGLSRKLTLSPPRTPKNTSYSLFHTFVQNRLNMAMWK